MGGVVEQGGDVVELSGNLGEVPIQVEGAHVEAVPGLGPGLADRGVDGGLGVEQPRARPAGGRWPRA